MTITELIGELKIILEEFGDIAVMLPQSNINDESGDEESWNAELEYVDIADDESGKVVVIY